MTIYIANAFSRSMMGDCEYMYAGRIAPEYITRRLKRVDFVSAVGHEDTAAIFSGILGVEIPKNRIKVTLFPGDTLYLGELNGERIPEGAKTLPEGASFTWYEIKVGNFQDIGEAL